MSGYIGTQPVPQATQTRDSFTATSGQTSFATGGYTPNFLDIFLNGVKLAAADYTASNGSDVVLASGASTGDILEVVAYTAFDTANVTGATNFTVTGAFTSQGIDDNGNATALTIDSSENLLVGQSSSTAVGAGNTTTGFSIRNDGGLYASRSSGPTITANANADGDIIKLYKSGTTVGSIGSLSSAYLYIGSTGGTDTFASFHNGGFRPATNTGADNDNALNLGDTGGRWKDLYLSGGVYLGGTGAANKLEDYEYGTWTPTGEGITYSTASGSYVKVGRMVMITYNITFPSTGNTGGAQINSLPFSATVGNAYQSGGYIAATNGGSAAETLFLTVATNRLVFRDSGNNNKTNNQFSQDFIQGSAVYMTD